MMWISSRLMLNNLKMYEGERESLRGGGRGAESWMCTGRWRHLTEGCRMCGTRLAGDGRRWTETLGISTGYSRRAGRGTGSNLLVVAWNIEREGSIQDRAEQQCWPG